MNTKEKRYTPEQMKLVSEFTQDYGIDPEQMTFFGDDPRPTFDAEAAAHLARTLAGAKGIAIGIVPAQLPDTISMECGMTIDGFFSSGPGSANLNELKDGEKMSVQQLERLAASRAIRSTLVYAGIDLLKLHRQKRSGVAQFTGPAKSNRDRLLARVHALGTEAGLIDGKRKGPWKNTLHRLYGVDSSGLLNDEQLADLEAFLSSLRPHTGVAKAA
ncbi:MAG: hypothetical protein AB7P97_21480 [Hyphomonadaceae bacterium]